MEPQRLAIVGVTLTIVIVGLFIGASFMTFPAEGGDTPLTKYTTDRDLLELGLSVPSEWSFDLSDESTLQMSDLVGQVVLVDLMATWCTTCATQNGYLETIVDNLAGSVVVVSLTVDGSETASMMADYKTNKGLDWAHGVDTGLSFKNYFDVTNVPSMVLIDADGVFRFFHVGLWSVASLSDRIASILT